MNDFGIIKMKFRNEFWLVLFREYISPVRHVTGNDKDYLRIIPRVVW